MSLNEQEDKSLVFDPSQSRPLPDKRDKSSAEGNPGPRRFGRRHLLAGAAGFVPVVAGWQIADGRPALAQQTDATPVASPIAGTPEAVTPGPEMIGQLQVIRDSRPVYDSSPVESDTLNLILTAGNNSNYNPAAFQQDFQILASHLDPLVWIDEGTMEPQPWLAESWDVSANGETITYHLRDDVRWHDGERLHARDVAFSLLVYRDDLDSKVRNLFTNMASAAATGATTVEVKLTSPDGNWLLNASSQFIFQQKQYRDEWESKPEGERTLTGFNWARNAPIGSGPWKIGKRGETNLELNRYGDYWAGPANFKKISLTWNTDSAQRLSAWQQGTCDLLWPVQASEIPTVSATPGRLYVADAAAVMFAAFNFDNPERNPPDFLTDINLRRALSLAIDRPRYATEVFSGFVHAEKAGTVAQPWVHDDSIVNPARDLSQARNLLLQGGYSAPAPGQPVVNADNNPLSLSVVVRNDSRPELLAVLQSVVADLAEVGVGLRIRTISPDRFFAIWTEERTYDLIAYSYNLFPGFTDFDLYGSNWDIRHNPQGWNPGAYSNEDADAAIRDILSATDATDQRGALFRLQKTVDDDLFGLWFGFPQDLILARPDILGFQPNIQWQTWDTRKLWRRPG